MFANAFQSGFLTLFYSIGSSPLSIWDKTVKNGHIRRIVDEEVKSLVLEIAGTNVATTYVTCPIKPRASLGVRLPFLVMVVKNLKKYFTFEIQILDDKDIRRRFRVSNFQSTTKVRPFCTTMPIGLSSGWNQIQFNLADFTKRAYGTTYVETVRVQIHANIRLRRIYFSNRLYSEDELPNEYKMFLPGSTARKSSVTASKMKQDTVGDLKKGVSMKLEEEEGEGQGEEPEPSAAPPSPVEMEEADQAQPSPVETSEVAPSTEVTAGDASEVPEGEKVEDLPAEVPTEAVEGPPAEGGDVAVEAPAEGGEGTEAPPAEPASESAPEAAPEPAQEAEAAEAPPAEDVPPPEAEPEAPPAD